MSIADDNGSTVNASSICIVFINNEPVPVINAPNVGYLDEPIQFTSEGSYDPDGKIVRTVWDFGDGFMAYTSSLFHDYSKTGTYLIKLTITDYLGKTSTLAKEIIISEKTRIDTFPVFTTLTICLIILVYAYRKQLIK